ncbi:IgGFc-binding protein-like [Sebastes umbrosus]|uniref:IgGFc-binding protein-like n=1 Tax=Sebastes umbrosus TaxID=72105 RepID=UPI0018A0CFC2|nr:IgGFc-binding protein-like [Sebastes umbrosus]
MSPLLLLLLLLAAVYSEFTPPENSTGLKFTVAFPENIAHYHPVRPQNKVQITALYDDTEVNIKSSTYSSTNPILNEGESKEYISDTRLELWKTGVSDHSVQIISNKQITVHAIHLKHNSVQTALVLPTNKLGTEYLIPPVPKIQGTTLPADIVTPDVPERGPFKLIIINGDKENKVTVEGIETEEVSLKPNQIWVKEDKALRTVKANEPVAVLFGHTCAIQHNCTCGQLYAMLPPATEEKLKFYIPPILAKNIEGESFVLLSDKQSTKVKPFDPDSPLVEIAGTAIFYRPGLLLTLIPETDFAACYVVNSIPDTESSALIVVHQDLTDGVHVGSVPLENPDWQKLKGTEYVSTLVGLASDKSVIWHGSSKMAVYFVGTKGSASFGNPAAIISKSPDFRGCVLSPEVIKIGEVANGWRESLKYCKDQTMELISFPEAQLQRQVSKKIFQANDDSLKEVWIGMRRSSQSGEWYWLNTAPVNDTNWEDGEPGTVHDGQCAIMSLEKDKDFGWSDEDCCKAARPVCYTKPIFLPI